MSSPVRMREVGMESIAISRGSPSSSLPSSPAKIGGSSSAGGSDFGEVLGGALKDAAAAERGADDAARAFAAGDPKAGIHEVVIAAEKATIAVKFAVTLKNRAIEAYKELLNTPV